MEQEEKKLGVVKLTFFAIGTTLATGVFSISGDFAAAGAHAGAVLIGWGICLVGMLGLAMTFYKLSVVRPDLTSGISNYAREGFGQYIGFISAWGYWISAVLAQVTFVALLFAALGNFFPVFGEGNNLASAVVASVFIWALTWLVYRGVNAAVGLNMFVVIVKVIPIIFAILAIILAGAFKWENFTANLWGASDSGSLFAQIKSTVQITVWTFVGIEGAVVLSGRGRTTKAAGQATIYSFLSLIALYILISVLSMGAVPFDVLAKLSNPPLAGVMEYVVGPWGGALVNIAVIMSLIGAMLPYVILCTDSSYEPAKQGIFPRFLTKMSRHNTPVWSIVGTSLVVQLFIVIMYFNSSTYQILYALSASTIMFPYVFSACFYLKLCCKGEGLEPGNKNRFGMWLTAVIGTVYGFWLLYGSGWQYILITSTLYFPGTILFYISKRERNRKIFETKTDWTAFLLVGVLFVISLVCLKTGAIQPF